MNETPSNKRAALRTPKVKSCRMTKFSMLGHLDQKRKKKNRWTKKRKVLFYKCIHLDLYPVTLWVVVNDRRIQALREFEDIFGKNKLSYGALHVSNGKGDFGLFFKKQWIYRDFLSHEVFHATHRIMEYIGDAFELHHQEPYAHLNGYLNRKVSRAIKKAGFKIKR